jgi:Flp pilus assembly protein TadB
MTGWAVGLGVALAALLGWAAEDAGRDPTTRTALRALRAVGGATLLALAVVALLAGAPLAALVAAAGGLALAGPALRWGLRRAAARRVRTRGEARGRTAP